MSKLKITGTEAKLGTLLSHGHRVSTHVNNVFGRVKSFQSLHGSWNSIKNYFQNVTQSDKKGLITGKHRCLINNLYFHFSASYNNSVNVSKISINFYIIKWWKLLVITDHIHRKSYRIQNYGQKLMGYKSLFVRLGHKCSYNFLSPQCMWFCCSWYLIHFLSQWYLFQ